MAIPSKKIGDTVELEYQLYKNKCTKEYWNLTGYEIRFVLVNGLSEIKKGTSNVTGGAVDQIEITTPASGLFKVILKSIDTATISKGIHQYEIEITSATGEKYTILQDTISFETALINWEDIT